jgi:hypothetical protein
MFGACQLLLAVWYKRAKKPINKVNLLPSIHSKALNWKAPCFKDAIAHMLDSSGKVADHNVVQNTRHLRVISYHVIPSLLLERVDNGMLRYALHST